MDQILQNVITLYGSEERFSNEIEISSINSLSRGVYAKKNLKKGELINQMMFISLCQLKKDN